MAITSYIVEEGHGHGKGHISHGNGKGRGHEKHAQDAMEDGVYTINISGVDHVNHGAGSQTSPQTTLADGSKINTEVRQGSITIDDDPGDGSANEALHLVTDSANGRLRLNTQLDADQQVTLGDLDQLSFDYFLASSDRTDVIPVIRLVVDADGNLATTGDVGELVFEWAYQGFGATTQDAWLQADLVGDDWIAWQRSLGVNHDQVANMTAFSDWADADGYTPAGGIHFDEDSLIVGWSVALGSGNGTTDAYLDICRWAASPTNSSPDHRTHHRGARRAVDDQRIPEAATMSPASVLFQGRWWIRGLQSRHRWRGTHNAA